MSNSKPRATYRVNLSKGSSSLGVRLKTARLLSGKTQTQLAEQIGIKQQAIQRIEADKVSGTTFIIPLAKALKVSPIWLSEGKSNSPVLATEEVVDKEDLPELRTDFQSVPLFDWSEILQAVSGKCSMADRKRIPCLAPYVSKKAFAVQLQMRNDSMVSAENTFSFYPNDILILDPACGVKSGDFVLVSTPQLILRKFVGYSESDGYLQALNSRYPSIRCDQKSIIRAVVVQRITLFLLKEPVTQPG